MCNLYSMTRNQDAIRRLFKVGNDSAGNMPSFPSIFPNSLAPVIRRTGDERELLTMHWGMPNPPQFGGYNTNIRNVKSLHWRRWMKPESRCLVPVTSFSEYAPKPNPATGKKDIVWFSIDHTRPLFAFAGLWTEWDGERGPKSKPTVTGKHLAYAFLTTDPNAVVAPIHPKAMPVILREDEWETWLTAPIDRVRHLQTPLADDQIEIVKRGPEKSDDVQPDHPPPEEDLGGGDICSLTLEPSTEDDRPLE